jgi:hypothetical protein
VDENLKERKNREEGNWFPIIDSVRSLGLVTGRKFLLGC